MQQSFQTIAVIGRKRDRGSIETLQALVDYLQERGRSVIMPPNSYNLLQSNDGISEVSADQLSAQCDLFIAVGGDGNLLSAARLAVDNDVPVLGINRGTLGFLTDINPQDLDKIGQVLDGQYHIETRQLLCCEVQCDSKTVHFTKALNEAVLQPSLLPQMIKFEVSINDQFVCREKADGVIIATPTGSTAYALSGGGPILEPHLNAFVLVPMFPHTLSNRPLVVNSDSEIRIDLSSDVRGPARLNCDGTNQCTLEPGHRVIIRKYDKALQLVHPDGYNYFETLRTKLGWGSKH